MWSVLFKILSLLVFVVAIFGVALVENMLALGLAFYVVAELIPMIPAKA